MDELIMLLLSQALGKFIEQGITYIIRQSVDSLGNAVTNIVVPYDDDGDGVTDGEEVIYTIDTIIPDLSDGYCICNSGDEVGIGIPMFDIVDGTEFPTFIDTTVTGAENGFLVDDDVYIPLPDLTGDGVADFGKLVDADDNNLPDASPDAPFYPVGSVGYMRYIENGSDEKSFIIVSADGTVSVYDPNGELTEEDYNQAYSLWVKDNGALDKPFANYSVTEALLFIVAVFAGVSLVGKLFKRRLY